MSGDRIGEESLKPDSAGLLLRERVETLEQVPVAMGRRDGSVAALGHRTQVRSLETEVTDDRARFVEGDERDELSGLVQMHEPIRIVEICVAIGVAERPIHALRDADRVLRTKAPD